MSISKKVLFDKGDVISWSVMAPGFYSQAGNITLTEDTKLNINLRPLPDKLFVWNSGKTKNYSIDGVARIGYSPVSPFEAGEYKRLTYIPGNQFWKDGSTEVYINAQDLTTLREVLYEEPGTASIEKAYIEYTENVTDMYMLFCNCLKLWDVLPLDLSSCLDASYMFYKCQTLTTAPIFNTHNVQNMDSMFSECLSLTSVNLDTTSVTNMNHMFYNCRNLTSVNLVNTSNVTNMTNMFYNCQALQDVSSLDFSSVTTANYMFDWNLSLKEIVFDAPLCTSARDIFGYLPAVERIVLNCPNLRDICRTTSTSISGNSLTYLDLGPLDSVVLPSTYDGSPGYFYIGSTSKNTPKKLTVVGGTNLGKSFNSGRQYVYIGRDVYKDSVIDLFNNFSSLRWYGAVVRIPNELNLTPAEIAILTNKNWQLERYD